jgi:hypothetical protein
MNIWRLTPQADSNRCWKKLTKTPQESFSGDSSGRTGRPERFSSCTAPQ